MRPAFPAIGVRTTAGALLARLAAASLAVLLPWPAAATCDAAVQAGAVVYTDAYDRIDRFDLAAGLPLPSIPARPGSPTSRS